LFLLSDNWSGCNLLCCWEAVGVLRLLGPVGVIVKTALRALGGDGIPPRKPFDLGFACWRLKNYPGFARDPFAPARTLILGVTAANNRGFDLNLYFCCISTKFLERQQSSQQKAEGLDRALDRNKKAP
jgi:hypothetical protein